jgi:hypothetical protein
MMICNGWMFMATFIPGDTVLFHVNESASAVLQDTVVCVKATWAW